MYFQADVHIPVRGPKPLQKEDNRSPWILATSLIYLCSEDIVDKTSETLGQIYRRK